MQGPFLRKYGTQTTVNFQLFETDGIDFKTDAAHVAGDTKIMKDEGTEGNTANGFTDEGQGYSIVLSATEMQAARIVVYVADQGTKAWLDTAIVIETYGNASAMHAFDLDTATVDVGKVNGTSQTAGDVVGLINLLNDLSAADVNAEVVDVLTVDTSTLPGQEAPTATPTLEEAIMWLYKVMRNKKEQTATTWSLYDDAGTTVDAKATVSDDGTTATKGEVGSGP